MVSSTHGMVLKPCQILCGINVHIRSDKKKISKIVLECFLPTRLDISIVRLREIPVSAPSNQGIRKYNGNSLQRALKITMHWIFFFSKHKNQIKMVSFVAYLKVL